MNKILKKKIVYKNKWVKILSKKIKSKFVEESYYYSVIQKDLHLYAPSNDPVHLDQIQGCPAIRLNPPLQVIITFFVAFSHD